MRLAFTMCRAVFDTRVSDTCGNTHYGFIVVRRISSRLVALVPLGPAAAAVVGGFAAAVALGLGESLSP